MRFDLPPLAEGLWQGTVAVETEDDLPLDNQRHVALLASQPYQVLLVDGRAVDVTRPRLDLFPGSGPAPGSAGRALFRQPVRAAA